MKEHGKAQAQKDDLFLACITSKEACQIEIGAGRLGRQDHVAALKSLGMRLFLYVINYMSVQGEWKHGEERMLVSEDLL